MNNQNNSYNSYNLEAETVFSQEHLRELFTESHFSPTTIKNYLADISHLSSWFEKEFQKPLTLPALTPEIIELFKKGLLEKQYSTRTINRHFSSLRALFKLLKKKGFTFKDPTRKIDDEGIKKDFWHIKQFKDYLYVFGSADLTIKNYILDAQHFLDWAEKNVFVSDFDVSGEHRFSKLSNSFPEYQKKLVEIGFSPASIKRKTSSIKKYFGWATKEGYLKKPELKEVIFKKPLIPQAPTGPFGEPLKPPHANIFLHFLTSPLRLFKRLTNFADFIFESWVVTPFVILIEKIERRFGKKETTFYAQPASFPSFNFKSRRLYFIPGFLLLIGLLGFLGYQLISKRTGPASFTLQAPTNQPLTAGKTRTFAFAGKLTDSANVPITKSVSVNFVLYPGQTDSKALWKETTGIIPDKEGQFSILLGEKTPLPGSLFMENETLFLGIKIEGKEELKPRQQIPNVDLSRNAQYLQGKTASSQPAANMVPILDSEGNLNLAAASPSIVSTSGDFSLVGESLILKTIKDGNITLSPDGRGGIDIQKALFNSTNSGTVPGAVEITDVLNIISTSSGQPAVTISQNGTGDLFSVNIASQSAFLIKNTGYVGIGTANPTKMLEVAGDIKIGSNLAFSGTSLNFLNNSATESARLTSTGNFGLGTAAPQGRLHVTGGIKGKALVIFDETGDQNILTASASGTTKLTLSRTGNLGLTGEIFNTTGDTFSVNDSLKVLGTTLSVGNGSAATIKTENAALTIDSGTGNSITLGSSDVLNMSGNFAQTGAVTFSTGTGAVSLNGAVTAGSTLTVTGAATLSSTLAVTGDTTLTGDLAINGGDLTTTATTFNLINTTATTLNIGGAATSLSLGASTGTTTVNNALAVTGGTTLTGSLTANGNVTLGNATSDTITATGYFASSLIPATTGYDLGTSLLPWANLYLSGAISSSGNITVSNTNPTITLEDTTTSEDDWNLNVDGNAFVIRNTTDTANYFTLSGTGDLTLTQDLAVNGADITTTSTGTATVFNTNATTLNIGGAATTVSLGAGTGTTTVNNNLSASGTSTLTGLATMTNGFDSNSASTVTSLTIDGTSGAGDLTINSGEISFTSPATTTTANSFLADLISSGTGIILSVDALTTGVGLDISSTSTAGTSNDSTKLLNLSRSGTNANASHIAYGLYSAITNTGTTSTNVGGYFSASGATNNYGLIVANGSVGIGDTSPAATLTVGDGDLFQVAGATGSVTVNNTSDTGSLSVEGTVLDINSLDFVGAGTLTSGAGQNLIFTPGTTGDLVFSTDADTTATFNGSAEGTPNVTLTAGDLTLTDGDLILSAGEISATSDDATGTNFSLTTGGLTSGTGIGLTTAGSASTAFTGDVANFAFSQAWTAASSPTNTGNVLDISRSLTMNALTQTLTQSGALVSFSSLGIETNGDLNDTSNILSLAQNCGIGVTCSGAVLKIANLGTGADIALANNETISNSTDGTISFGADKLTLTETTAVSGNLLTASYAQAVSQTGALYGLVLDTSTNLTVPNTSSGNQSGVQLTVKDGGALATAIGIEIDGTADRGIDFSGLTTSTGGAIIYNDTSSTIDLAAASDNVLEITNSSGTTSNDNIVTLEIDANTDASDKILFRVVSDVGGSEQTKFTIDSDGDISATNLIITTDLTCTDCLDFTDFEDTLDLDNNLTLNQTTYTWGQTFTGDTTVGLTYTANSLTTGTALRLTSSGTIAAGGELLDLVANSLTTGNLMTASATSLTSGSLLSFAGPSGGTVGSTGNLVSLTSDIGNAGSMIKSTTTFDSTAAAAASYNLNLSTTNANGTNANSAYGLYSTLSDAVALANTDYGLYSTVTNTGVNTLGTKTVYGTYSSASNTSTGVGGTAVTYGGYFTATGDGGGTSTATGLYATASGADNNYAAIFEAGNVGIGTTTTNSDTSGLQIKPTAVSKVPLRITDEVGNESFIVYLGSDGSNQIWQYNATGSVTNVFGTDGVSYITGGSVGIGTTAPDAALEINHATGDSLRLTYNDSNGSAANYTDFSLSSDGALTVTGSAVTLGASATAEKTFFTLTPGIITLTAPTAVTSLMETAVLTGATIAADAATTVNKATTLSLTAPVDSTNATITDNSALRILNVTSGAGTLTNQYGLYVEDMTAGVSDYGIAIEGADTAALWLSSAADNTDAANGIAFGSSKDTNLYRSAANTLKTDDSLTVGVDLTVSGGDITGTGDEGIDIGEATANAITFLIDATGEAVLTSSALSPVTSDGSALGTSSLMWGDLFLASGGVINFNNGDVTLTHASNVLAIEGGSVGIGTTGPDSPLDVLSTGGSQLRLTYTDGSVYTTFNTDSSGNLNIDATGTKTVVADDLQVTGNDILSSTATALTLAGADVTVADDLKVTGTLGIGVTPSPATYALYLEKTMTDPGGFIGAYTHITATPSDAMSGNFYGNWVRMQTAINSATTNVVNMRGLYVDWVNSVAGGATVTSQTGAYFDTISQVTGVNQQLYLGSVTGGTTGNYGLYSINSATGVTVPAYNIYLTDQQTVNTTSGALTNYAAYITNTGSRSAGANALTNVGLYVTASGAQNNYAAIFEAGSVGIGTTGPDSPLDVLSTGGTQLRLTYTDGSVSTTFNTDSSGNLNIDATGTKTVVADDLQVTGNDILSSTATALTLAGADVTVADDLTVTGREAIGTTLDTSVALNIIKAEANPAATKYGVYTALSTTETVASNANQVMGLAGLVDVYPGNTQAWTNTYGVVGVYGRSKLWQPTAGSYTVTGAAQFVASANVGGANVTLTNRYGMYVEDPSNSGTLNNNYGLYVADQTAGSSDYGLAIEGADTAALWLSSAADNTDAANGITFGSSKDTNLYRSAANTLKTDDNFIAASGIDSTAIGANTASTGAFTTLSATPGSNATALTLTGTNVTSANLAYLNSKNTSGTILNLAYGAAATLGGALTGQAIDLSTNVTNVAQSVTGESIALPIITAANTTTVKGLTLSTGAFTTAAAVASSTWTGLDITMPAITQGAGSTLTSTGLKITGGTVTSGTSYGLIVDSNAGNVGIGDTSPAATLTVGDGDLFQVAGTTGSVTINNASDTGSLSVEGTILDINSLDFVGAGTLTSGAGQNLTFTPGTTGDLVFSTDADTVATFNGSAEGTPNVTLTAGDLTLTDGDLIVTAGDFSFTGATGVVNLSSTLDIDSAGATIDSTTLSIDSTDTTNLTMTANAAGDKTLTVSATNAGAGAGLISISADGNINIDTSAGILYLNNTNNQTINTGTGDFVADSTGTFSAISAATINLGTANVGSTIQLGTEGTTADTITIGNTNASTTLALTGGDDWKMEATGILTLSASAAQTTAIVITDTDYTNSLSIADNNIIGTTANIDLTYFDVTGATGAVTIDPQTTGTYLDFILETAWTSGTLINADVAVAGITQGAAAITGMSLNLNSNVTTPVAGQNVTGYDLQLPTASTTSNATTYTGFNLGTTGAITNATAGSFAWRGLNVAMPNITQSAGGSVTSSGLLLTTGSITTAGTQHGLNVSASGVGAGTLNAINIGTITGSGGTETAINIAAGWDTDINATTSLEIGIGGTNEFTLTATDFSPSTSDGSALGTTSLMWGDLFLASGGVINFNNGDVTLTHAANILAIEGGSVGIGTTGPDSPLDVLSTGGSQLRLTYTDGSVYTTFNTDSSGNLTIDGTGTKTIIADDLQVTGNDILSSTATALTLSGADVSVAGDLTVGNNALKTTSGVAAVVAANTPWGVFKNTNPTNILPNADFESWTAGTNVAPDGWANGGGNGSFAKETTTIKLNTASVKLVSSAGGGNSLRLRYTATAAQVQSLKGKTVTFAGWLYASAASVARLTIYEEPGGAFVNSPYHTGDSTWQWISVTHAIPSNATVVLFDILENAPSATIYADGLIVSEGPVGWTFAAKPLNDTDSQNVYGATNFLGNNVGIGDATPDYTLELYDATNTPTFALSDDDIAHGVTTLAQTDVFFHLSSISTTDGGAQLTGLADATGIALGLKGVQSSDPTDTTPAISLIGAKASGTGVVDLAAAETVLQIANNDNTAALTILGDGKVGIGAATPGYLLDVAGVMGVGVAGATEGKITFETTGTETDPYITAGAGNIELYAPTGWTNFYPENGIRIGGNGNNIWWTANSGNAIFDFYGGSATALTIKNTNQGTGNLIIQSGSIGINTTGPDRVLDSLAASAPQLRLTQADGTVYSEFQTDSSGDLTITTTGDEIKINDHLIFSSDNTYDVGASGATRPRTGYFGTSVVVGSTVTVTTNAITASGALTVAAGGSSDLSLKTGTSNDILFKNSSGTTRGRLDTEDMQGPGTGADGSINVTGTTKTDATKTGVSTTSNSGQTVVSVSSTTGFSAAQEVLIIQMTGTGAGSYETRIISSVGAGSLTMTANLTNTYTDDGSSKAQVIKVPQYTTVTVSNGGTLTADAWNGTTGGVVFFRAQTSVTVNSGGKISADALGFTGGALAGAGTGGAAVGSGVATGNNGNAGSTGNLANGPSGTISNTGGGAGGNPGSGGIALTYGGGGAGGTGGGGAGGSYGTAGSGGGAGASGAGGNGGGGTTGGTGGSGSGGTAGSTYGVADLSSQLFLGAGGGGGASGAGGGSGSGHSSDGGGGAGGNGGYGQPGGTGGGIIYINTPAFTNNGTLESDGGNGTQGANGSSGSTGGGTNPSGGGGGASGAGGGGGAGGAIYLNASSVTLGTTTATGGSGGSGGGTGGNGASGTPGVTGGGGGGVGNPGGALGTGGYNGTAGATAAPGSGGAGGNGRVKCDGTCSGTATPTVGSTGSYSAGNTSNPYGTLYIGATSTTSSDVAEYYRVIDRTLESGDVVIIDESRNNPLYIQNNSPGLARAPNPYDRRVLGIISTQPGIILGYKPPGEGEEFTEEDGSRILLALSGRVPTKVSTENGPIAVGDSLTSSSTPGVAMKATRAGPIVGKTLEAFNCSTSEESKATSEVTTSDGGSSDGECQGKIMAFVNVSWFDPDVYLANTGELVINKQLASPSSILNPQNSTLYSLSSTVNGVISRVGAFSEAVIANLQVGSLTANKIVSPLAEIDEVKTNIISPLAQDSSISLSLKPDKIEVLNTQTATPSAVASFDNQGNATFSGQLSSDSLTSNEATIAGTLRAGKIVADDIEGLNAKIATLSANNITNITNVYETTPLATSNELLATSSGQLAFPTFSEGLVALGPTSLTDLSVAGNFYLGANFIISQNSIEVLGSDLSLQGLRQGGIALAGGRVYIDRDGNLKVEGDVSIGGTLAANIISPLPDQDLVIHLGGVHSATSEVTGTGSSDGEKLVVQNASGSAVLSVNQTGDLTASGSATFKKLNLFSSPVFALSDTEIIASGSAGRAAIKKGVQELTIKNSLVTGDSLIYVTPVASDSAQSAQPIYLLRQLPADSFTVGVNSPADLDTPFNWLIIN